MDHMGQQHNEHSEHDKHAGHSPEMFRQKFWLSLVFTIPTILYSQTMQHWLHFSMPNFFGSQ
jgi:Cu2+-exporting ATPase